MHTPTLTLTARARYGLLNLKFTGVTTGFAVFLFVTSLIFNGVTLFLAIWGIVVNVILVVEGSWDGWNILWLILLGLYVLGTLFGKSVE